MSRGRRNWLATAVLALGAGAIGCSAVDSAATAAERERRADAAAAAVGVSVEVLDATIAASSAIADFGVGEPVRLVSVRIVDGLDLTVRIEAASEVVTSGPLRACVVGPDAAPDDAGLEARCWGDGSLEMALGQALAVDAAGRLRLAPGAPLEFGVRADRGGERCDFPPGPGWRLEVLLDPVIDGSALGPRYAADATFEVPFDPATPVTPVAERLYCGLASRTYREQGEPTLIQP